ncbi:MAG TPA: fumarylacetoacetate hydrolase family protein [Gaiella sp.]|jgi:2-dehydro-3-deoxy-D-arabinonate dehydratase|nr:fumarylacetoacetate hydrolase family protein [Gaiella sp.]
MRRIVRWVDGAGRVSVGVEVDNEGHFRKLSGIEDPMPFLRGEMFSPEGRPVTPADPYSLELGDGLTLITPLDPPEVWCAGVTYERSRDARVEESAVRDVYDLVYEAHRPELFLKDAAGRRTVGPGEPIGIRGDSTWNVPEPEIGVVVGERGRILAYTIGNDVSSREIEGANPLYLTQAKVYAGACAIGPALYIPPREPQGFQIIMRISNEEGDVLYEDKTSTTYMVRTFDELATWLVKENPVPPGSVLLTGTGLVPPDSFSMVPGNWVEIHVPEIGTLVNPVALATTLL